MQTWQRYNVLAFRGGVVADESLDAVVVSRALNMAALALVKAYSAPWVLPLFSEHLEFAGGPVSADWFHQKVADALEEIPEIAGDLPAAEHCRKWVSQEWLMRSRSRDDGRLQYQLSESSLRALRIVRDLVTPGTSVSEARLGSIADAVRRLADMTNPDISAQLARIDAQIEELQERRRQVEAGHLRRATTEEMTRQLGEVMGLMASLPADFRQLCAMVEKRHHEVTSAASSADSTKGAVVEEYLHEHDLLAQTSEGRAPPAATNPLRRTQTSARKTSTPSACGPAPTSSTSSSPIQPIAPAFMDCTILRLRQTNSLSSLWRLGQCSSSRTRSPH